MSPKYGPNNLCGGSDEVEWKRAIGHQLLQRHNTAVWEGPLQVILQSETWHEQSSIVSLSLQATLRGSSLGHHKEHELDRQ